MIDKVTSWAGFGSSVPLGARPGDDPALDRKIASSLTDEALAWRVGSWRQRYL
ncbi:MAG: hypothetical protein WCE30_00910 [Mycobacterium sp.]